MKFQKQDKEHRLHKQHGKKKRSNITAIVMMIYNEIHDVFRLVAWESECAEVLKALAAQDLDLHLALC